MTEEQFPKQVPQVVFKVRVPKEGMNANVCTAIEAEWKDVTTDDLFKGKKVVVFSLPGAFTPTCSSTHLPGYEAKYDEFKALGVDDIICMSVNDGFVMYEWGKTQGAKNVHLIPDGSGAFTKGMEMLVKKNNLGFGERSWRYSMLVDNGEVKKVFIEPGFSDDCPLDPFEVSDADTMLNYLKTA